MLVVRLKFPTGAYHATPWGRHVNEGVPEWPPSPYRLVRALLDAWKRKHPELERVRVEPILEKLSAEAPVFYLPERARTAHVRAYLSKNTGDPADKTLIFDAGIKVSPGASVLVGWPAVTLSERQEADLSLLLESLSYLGRSESWVEAEVATDAGFPTWNCYPPGGQLEEGFETVRVACAVGAAEFERLVSSGRLPGKVLPGSWLEAIACSTGDLMRSRLSQPPAMREIVYLRSAQCLDGPVFRRARPVEARVSSVLYKLDSVVLPSVTDTILVAESARVRALGAHKRIAGQDFVSESFSGKDTMGNPLAGDHRHSFFLPLDLDYDGKLDHLLITSRCEYEEEELRALDNLWPVPQRSGHKLYFVPLKWGSLQSQFRASQVFRSATPYVPTLHHRRGRGAFEGWLAKIVADEAERRLGLRPVVRALSRGAGPGGQAERGRRWLEFRRNRKGDPASMGFGFEFCFPEPVEGPFALGYACHYGLGLFLPVKL